MAKTTLRSPLPSSISESMGVRITSVGHFIDQRVCQTFDRVRDDYLLLATLEGTAWVSEEGSRRDHTPGDWLLLRPGLTHSYTQVTNWTLAWVHFEGPLVAMLLHSLGLLSGERLRFRQRGNRSRDLLMSLIADAHGGAVGDEVRLNARLIELIACVHQDYTLETEHTDPMAPVLDHINRHLGDEISLAELAQKAHLSTYHFARSFKRRFGHAPMRFVRKSRVESAQDLFTGNPDALVSDVARRVGFEDALYFSTVFRKWTGLSPSEYKERVRLNGPNPL